VSGTRRGSKFDKDGKSTNSLKVTHGSECTGLCKTISCSKLMGAHGGKILKIYVILALLMLVPVGLASENITPDDIMAWNASVVDINGTIYVNPTTSQINATQVTTGNLAEIGEPLDKDSLLNESTNYTYSKDIDQINNVEIIKINFVSSIRGADQDLGMIDRVWQVSDTDPSQVLFNSSEEIVIAVGMPLVLKEGYRMDIKSIDIGGSWTTFELSKDGSVVDTKMIALPQSAAIFRAYKEVEKQDPVYWYYLGMTLSESNDYNEAIGAFDRAIELDPSYEAAWLKKVACLDAQENTDEAIKSLDKFIELNQSSYMAWFTKGSSLYRLGRYDEAINAIDKAIELDPPEDDEDDFWAVKGEILKELGRDSEANAAFAKITTAKEWYDRGIELYSKAYRCDTNLLNKSVEAFDKALNIDPEWAMAWSAKADAFSDMGRYDLALEAQEKSIELDPEDIFAWSDKAAFLRALGKFEESLQACETAIKIDPYHGLPWFHKGKALRALNRNTEADKAFEKACAFDSAWCGGEDNP